MIQDNTTKWKVRKFTDFASNDALPVGFIYQHLSSVVPVGSLPLFGAEYDRTLYADLWSWANENGLVVTEEEWQESASASGGSCAKFSEGNGTTTFRVPALKCWVKGANGVEEVGGYLEAGLPNITGRVGSFVSTGSYTYGKALTFEAATSNQYGLSSYGGLGVTGSAILDASQENPTYGNSDTVQPPSIVAMYCIKAFGTVSNVGNADVGNVMQAVEQVQTELPKKANLGALSMPSENSVNVSIETGRAYIAPCDGWFYVKCEGKAGGSYIILHNDSTPMSVNTCYFGSGYIYAYIPLARGQTVTLVCDTSVNLAKFLYAQSEV